MSIDKFPSFYFYFLFLKEKRWLLNRFLFFFDYGVDSLQAMGLICNKNGLI